MGIKLFIAQLLGKKLTLGKDEKEVKVHKLSFVMPLPLLVEHDKDGFRLATKNELEIFAREYPLSRWHPGIVGIGHSVSNPKVGLLAKVYRIKESWVQEDGEGLEWELRPSTYILLVRDKPSLN